jgi:hypothetical protein
VAGRSISPTAARGNALIDDRLAKLAALVDHYYAAYREARATIDRRDREIAELRRNLNVKPSPLCR